MQQKAFEGAQSSGVRNHDQGGDGGMRGTARDRPQTRSTEGLRLSPRGTGIQGHMWAGWYHDPLSSLGRGLPAVRSAWEKDCQQLGEGKEVRAESRRLGGIQAGRDAGSSLDECKR